MLLRARRKVCFPISAALKQYSALEVINGPLMAGMSEVGRYSITMNWLSLKYRRVQRLWKHLVAYLEQFMAKHETP